MNPPDDLPFQPGDLNPPFETLLHRLVEEGKVQFTGIGPEGKVRYAPVPGYTWEMVFERARQLAAEIREERE